MPKPGQPRPPLAGDTYGQMAFWRHIMTLPRVSSDTRIFARRLYEQAKFVADRRLYKALNIPMPAWLAKPPPEPQEYRDAMARIAAKRPRALRG